MSEVVGEMLMRKYVVSSIVTAFLLVVVLLSFIQTASANETSIRINAKAQASSNDIVVSGKVFLKGLEDREIITVDIGINLKRPDGSVKKAAFKAVGLNDGSGVTILPYEYIFEDCVNEKGIYEIEVTVKYRSLTATAYFKFDPPSGGTPGVPC